MKFAVDYQGRDSHPLPSLIHVSASGVRHSYNAFSGIAWPVNFGRTDRTQALAAEFA
jgi:hypothetical protein